MKGRILTSALALVAAIYAQSSIAQNIPIGVQGSVPVCTYAELQAGTCQQTTAGFLATITDGNPADADPCAAAGTGGVPGNQYTCRYDGVGGDWEEFDATGGGGGATNLGTNLTPTDVTVTSDTGSDAVLPAATGSNAGVLSAADKTKLDGLSANPFDDIFNVTCSGGSTTIPAATGIFRITTGCADGDTIVISDVGALTATAVINQKIINSSGFRLVVDASANTGGADFESGLNVVYPNKSFFVTQMDASEVDIASTAMPFGDVDGDGLFEVAYLYDADGDGSGYVDCVGKADPDPACRAAGTTLYRDTADDLNCQMHGCGFGQMELTGQIKLPEGVHVIWPCWDAALAAIGTPGTFNDPTAANDDYHDSTADTAWGHCAPGPDPLSSRRIGNGIATLGWQGSIVGAGVDTRNPETTANYKRDMGTYLVDDRGPTWSNEAGINLGNNTWFGLAGFVRGISFGFQQSNNVGAAMALSGEEAGDGDSKGSWVADGTQAVGDLDGSICVNQDAAIEDLVAGDWLIVVATSDGNGETASLVNTALRVRNVADLADCNGPGTASIPIGGQVSSGTGATYSSDPPLIWSINDGQPVIHARSDFMSASATLSNVTLEPQDAWNRSGDDCGVSGMWTFEADVEEVTSDRDCDTMPLVGIFGAGTSALRDVVIRHWHSYAVDGNSNAGHPIQENVRWFYGNGGPIADVGYGWLNRRLEVWNSQFDTSIIATFGPGTLFEGLGIYNSTALNIVNLGARSLFNVFRDVELFGSAVTRAYSMGCDARQNRFEGLRISGAEGDGETTSNGFAVFFDCSNSAEPQAWGNIFTGFNFGNIGASTYGDAPAAVVTRTNTIVGTDNTDAFSGNHFSHFVWDSDDDDTQEICMFGAHDSQHSSNGSRIAPNYCTGAGTPLACCTGAGTGPTCTDDYNYENVLAKNAFFMNSIRNRGPGGVARMFCGCNQFAAAGDGDSRDCGFDIEGSANGGADPLGCGNFENGVVPAIQGCR